MSASEMLGSSVSLQGPTHSSTDIPKEYHRKLLKKIAQLTKVIYVLNTKNDENDEFVLNIRAQHNAELLKLSGDWSDKLKQAQEECRTLKETAQRTQDVVRELEVVTCERDGLKASEVRLLQLQGLSSNQMKELDNQLNQLKRENTNRVAEVSELLRQHEASLKAAQSAHEQELVSLRATLSKGKELVESELERVRRTHEAELRALRQQFESKAQLSENALVAAEGKRWQERLEGAQREAEEKENALSCKVSQLSTELRVAKDKLTLSEQKVRDLEANVEERGGNLASLQSKLVDAQDHIRSLQSAQTSLLTELGIAKDKHQQQCAELLKMSNTIGKLEGIRVSNTGEIESLKSSIGELKEKLSWLEKEKGTLVTSQKASEQNQLKIKNLEREVGRLIKEKQELHTQYAHEIEAAHSQLNEREHELEVEHRKVLQELKEQQQKVLSAAMKEKDSELTALRKEVETRSEEKMAALEDQHQKEVHSLQTALAGRTVELESALSSLERLKREVEEKKEGLGSVSSHMMRLSKELEESHQAAEAVQKQLATERMENERLQLTLKGLRDDHTNTVNDYKKQVERVQVELTSRLEGQWTQRLRDECSAVRSELAQRHKGDLDCALAELCALKDQAMRDAAVLWSEEHNKLTEQITSLMEKLETAQCEMKQSIENARTVCNEQLAALRRQMDSSTATHEAELQRMMDSHRREMNAIRQQHQIQTEDLRKELSDAHSRELQLIQQSNLICVRSMQEEWRRSQAEEICRVQAKHSADLDNLHNRLQSKYRAELASEKEQCQSELQKERQAFEEKWRNAQKEVTFCRLTIGNLEAEAERRVTELDTLRNKVSDLTGAMIELRRELEVKGQEILSVRREANSQVQLQHQQLSAAHRAELDSINRHHQHRVQSLLNDFNKAKELLIQKIGELERRHQEAEERYKRRESRPEDLEEIQTLKATVVELQTRVKGMAAEMRIYQLELTNREKNYNKLFAANPLVGVLDPMAAVKKKAAESGRHSSAPSLIVESTGEEAACLSTPPLRRLTRHLDPIEPKTKAHRIVTLKDSPPQPTKILPSSVTTPAQPLPIQL